MKRIFSDTIYTSTSYLTYAVSQIVIQILVVKFVSLEEFGEFTTASAIENLVETIFITRSSELSLQFVGKHWIAGNYFSAKICVNRIKNLDWIINLVVYALIVLISISVSHIFNFNINYLLILGLQIPAQIGYGIYKSIFISASKIREQAIFEISFSVFLFLSCLLGVSYYGIYGFMVAWVVSAFAKTLAADWITRQWWPKNLAENTDPKKGEGDVIDPKAWMSFSTHSILRNIFSSGASQIDILLLSVRGPEVVAIYKIAKSLASLPARVVGPIWSSLRPRIMYLYNNNKYKELRKLVILPSLFMLCFLTIFAFPASLISTPLIARVYGESYTASALPFLVLFVGNCCMSILAGWFGFWIVISSSSYLGGYVYGFLAFFILIFGFLLGNKSANSMALVVSSAMIFTSLLCWVFFLFDTRISHKIEPKDS